MALDIDGVLEAIGEVGPYQRRIYFLLCLPVIFVGASNLSYVFIAAIPHYRCVISGCDDSSHPVYGELFLNYTIPWDENIGEYESCREYSRNSGSNLSSCLQDDFTKKPEQCKYGVLFDTSIYESTITTEFNLTCSKGWEASADQAIYFAGMLIGSVISGILSDTFGRRKTILSGIVIMAASGIAVALVPNLYSFHVMRFFNAMSTTSVFQTAFILGLEFVGPRKRVMFGVVGEFFFAFGQVFLGLIAWAIRSWRMIQLVISTPIICFTFYYWVVPESVRWLQARGRHAQVVASLENIAKMNKKTIPLNLLKHQVTENAEDDETDDLTILINRHHKVTVLDVFRSPLLTLRTLFMIIIWISVTLAYYGLSYNATDIGAGKGANKPFVNFILSALVEIPGYSLAWIGMEYWGRKGSLISSLLFAGSACISAGYVKGFLPVLLIFLVGKCNITCAFAIIYVYTAEMFPTNVRNTIIGMCSMFARIGGMLAPFSSSLRNIYLPFPLLLFGILSILSGMLALVMPETLNTKLPETISDAVNLGKRNIQIRDAAEETRPEDSQRLIDDTTTSSDAEPLS